MISPTFRTVQMTEHTQTHNFAPIGQLVIDPWNFEYCAKQQSLSVSKKNVSRPVRVQNPSKIILMCCPAILPLHAKAKNLSSPPYTRTGDLYLAIYTRVSTVVGADLRVIFTVRIGASWPWRVLVNQIVWCSKTRLNVESDIWVCDMAAHQFSSLAL